MPKRGNREPKVAKTPDYSDVVSAGEKPNEKQENDALQDQAFLALRFRSRSGIENSSDGFVEYALQIALCESRALEVLVCSNLLGHGECLFIRDGFHLSCTKGLRGRLVVSQIQLGADEDDGNVGCMVLDLRIPLGFHVVKGWRADDREANEKDVGLRVRQGSQSVVILLSGGIPQTQADGPTIHHHARRVIIEDRRYIFAGESICCVGDEKTCFADGTVTRYHTLYHTRESACCPSPCRAMLTFKD